VTTTAPLPVPRSTPSAAASRRKATKSSRVAPTIVAADTASSTEISTAVAPADLPGTVVEPAAATPTPVVADRARPQYKDGTYLGWGTSRHGDIQAQVVIEGGRIASATIAQCLTRYSCSVIDRLPPQVAARQSPETDFVSGATQSTNAFYYAVVEALSKAK
jgi:uncharacterized protein with FMN-binding domain